MGYKVEGSWKNGFAFDLHTISSAYLGQDEFGHDKYENTRTEMGELVYQLKYKYDESVVKKIVDLLKSVKGLEKIHAIVPIPPSNTDRRHQPVFLIAEELGISLSIPVYIDCLAKSEGAKELKNITDNSQRMEILKKSMFLTNNRYNLADKNILLIDDLYRSGSTLEVATNLLYSQAKVQNVYVLTMTKTRSNK